jgi:hypothetical protein
VADMECLAAAIATVSLIAASTTLIQLFRYIAIDFHMRSPEV